MKLRYSPYSHDAIECVCLATVPLVLHQTSVRSLRVGTLSWPKTGAEFEERAIGEEGFYRMTPLREEGTN